MKLDSKVPGGPLEKKWDKHIKDIKLVSPNNKRKYEIIVVGTGLAGGAAAASFAELGYNVRSFCIQDSARRATVLQLRVVSMPPRIIPMMETVSGDYSMIR